MNHPHTSNNIAIIAILLAVMFYTLNDSVIKLATQSQFVGQFMVLRGALASLFAYIWCIKAGQSHKMGLLFTSWPAILRVALEGIISVLFLLALTQLPVADAVALLMISPLLIFVLAAFYLKEPMKPSHYFAVLLSFVGMMLIVRPQGGGSLIAYVYTFIAALCIAVRDIATRKVPGNIPSHVMGVYTSLSVVVAGAFVVPFEGWGTLYAKDYLLIFLSSLIIILANYCTILAYRGKKVGAVTALRYSEMAWAIIFGYLFFKDFPDIYALLGMALIILAGIYTLLKEKRLS